MAPVPKKKHTRSRSNIRRGTKKATLPHLVKCKSCGKPKVAHSTCKECGKY